MRILVTNDDGIDSLGLHILAQAMTDLGEVTVAAPDQEYSGCGASIGAVYDTNPEVNRVKVEGIDKAWSITGPPALCVLYAHLGLLEKASFDLVVSGINPGANVGNAIYHSGTVGAALTARNIGLSAVAVSQSVDNWELTGQEVYETNKVVSDQIWETAAQIAHSAVKGIIENPPPLPSILNINVPNDRLENLKGWRYTEISDRQPLAKAEAKLEAKPGHKDSYGVSLSFNGSDEFPPETDSGSVKDGYVSMTWLSGIEAIKPDGVNQVDLALDSLLDRAS